MNKPDSHIHKLIDRMTCSNMSFAIYRLPWTDIPLLVMQDGGEPQTFSSLKELNGQKKYRKKSHHLQYPTPNRNVHPPLST